jgi:hypothetical protein
MVEMIFLISGCLFLGIGLYYLFNDLSGQTPTPGVGMAAACFFIAAIMCLK